MICATPEFYNHWINLVMKYLKGTWDVVSHLILYTLYRMKGLKSLQFFILVISKALSMAKIFQSFQVHNPKINRKF